MGVEKYKGVSPGQLALRVWHSGPALHVSLGKASRLERAFSAASEHSEASASVSTTLRAPQPVRHEPYRASSARAAAIASARAAAEDDKRKLDAVLAQLANATILTVGTTTADNEAGSFQVKVANPPGIAEDENIADRVVNALVEQFGDVLAVIQPVRFDAEGDPDYSSHTFALERKSLGESIGHGWQGAHPKPQQQYFDWTYSQTCRSVLSSLVPMDCAHHCDVA